jgi:hypothetical protein
MNDSPTAAPPREDDATRIAAYFIEAEGGRIVRDMAGHVGDEIHEVLKRHGLTMTTAAGAIGVGVLAGVQVLNETLEFAMRSVDTEAEKASIAAGVAALVGAHIAPSLGTDASLTTVPPAAAPIDESTTARIRILVSGKFSAAHRCIEGHPHKHTWHVTAWFASTPRVDARLFRDALDTMLAVWDGTELEAGRNWNEDIVADLANIPDCVEVRVWREADRLGVHWAI